MGTAVFIASLTTALGAATGYLGFVNRRRAAAQGRLTRRLEFTSGLLAACPDPLIGTDLSGAITAWNGAAERLFGYSEMHAVGKPLSEVLPFLPRDTDSAWQLRPGETVRASLLRTFARGTAPAPVALELLYSPQCGADGTLLGRCIVLHDVTAHRQLAMSIRAERTQLTALLERSTDGIHVLDEQGNLVFFSDSFARMLGYSTREELRGANVACWSTADAGTRFVDTMAGPLQGPTVTASQIRRRDGELLDVEIGELTIELDGDHYAYRSARDISARHRAELEDRNQLQELTRLNKELDDFVIVASHDLRSPLRAITTLAQWIIDDDRSVGAKTAERLKLIQSRAQRMMQLLDDVMSYARAGKSSEPTGPLMSAAALTAEVAATLQIPVGFRILTDAALDGIRVRRVPLQQVLHNLLGNAIKHHDLGQGSVRIWVADRADRHRFFVADDGPGIPPEFREVVFQMFATLKPRDTVEGSGMGLAMVRRIVTRLGGECGVEESTGRGACLWFDWPKAQPA
jgi:PAS domain S-box-containing protein